jgi:hypothetical protein
VKLGPRFAAASQAAFRRICKPLEAESFDHVVRSSVEFRRIQGYIENNPITAGLAGRPEEYFWSSARQPERPPQIEDLPH